ncbi:carbohydrate sulfotransferase 11-like [Oculina patagonica]
MPDPFHIAVIPSLKILYCITPKVASRQWRQMLYQFNTRTGPGQLRLETFSPHQQKQMLQTYFKFTFVREPFERILSAYKDKFLYPRIGDRPILEFHGREILKNFRPNASQSALEELHDITFREFIEYLVTKGSSKSTPVMDWHWDNYVNICGMCAVKYDFIGHYETFDQDLSDFKEAAKLSAKQAKFFNAYMSNISDTASSMLSYYSQVPIEWINVLGQMLRANFEMFGYSFPGPLKSLFE